VHILLQIVGSVWCVRDVRYVGHIVDTENVG
jgi:hypothetical protein